MNKSLDCKTYLCYQCDQDAACMQRWDAGHLDFPVRESQKMAVAFRYGKSTLRQTNLGVMRAHGHGLCDLIFRLGLV